MIKSIRDYLASYNILYWITIVMIAILSTVLFVINNFSSVPTKQMMNDAVSDSNEIKKNLYDTQQSFTAYETMLNRLADALYEGNDIRIDDFLAHSGILLDGFSDMHSHVSGYFVDINGKDSVPLAQKYFDFKTGQESHISVFMDYTFMNSENGLNSLLRDRGGPVFVAVPASFVGGFELCYAVPLYIDGEARGSIGIVLNKASLGAMFGEKSNPSRQMTLLARNLQIISSTMDLPVGSDLDSIQSLKYFDLAKAIRESKDEIGYLREKYDGRSWTNIFVKLPSGQIFWESFDTSKRLAATNISILLLSVFAVFCNWVVQKRNGISPFDGVADFILARTAGLSEKTKVGNKASLSVHMAMTFVWLALLIFSFFGEAGALEQITYAVFLALAVFSMSWYRKANHSLLVNYIYLSYFLAPPVIVHHVTGGFLSQSAGQIMFFCVMAVIISSLILKDKQKLGIFSLFVAILFLDAIIEIHTIESLNQEAVIRSVTLIFFMGFAVFLSTDLFVSGGTDLLTRLNDAQSLLVKKEKMVTLGNLIAGVAHEINTPLGAIKASAESLISSSDKAFSSLMNAGLSIQDRDFYFRLVDIVTESISDSYTTMQIRKSKPVLRAFFEELGYENPEDVVDMLVRLEVCNIEVIKANRDIFESGNIVTLLDLLIATAPIIRSSYIILHSAAKTSKIVFALKSYSHTTAGSDFTWFDIVQNIDNVLVLLYNQIKRSIVLIRNFDDDIPKMYGNSDELGQVWINIIQNSIYAMKETGTLEIGVRMENNETVHISISDTGCGISPDIVDSIFEPFYTTKPVGEGSGLGLDICRKIILSHGGTIDVESTPNVGTAFHIRLPVQARKD